MNYISLIQTDATQNSCPKKTNLTSCILEWPLTKLVWLVDVENDL